MGLSVEGGVWSTVDNRLDSGNGLNRNMRRTEMPVISAGDIPLLTEQRRRNGTRILTLHFNDRFSTLTSSPAWPVLIWNILKYRAGQTVGVTVNNVKLGTEAEFVPAEDDKTISVTTPNGETQTFSNSGSNPLRIQADQVGIFQISATSGTYEFAAGTLSAEESNLLDTATVTLGNWYDEETLRSDFQPLAWLFLLSVIALMSAHLWLMRKNSNPER
jgi:hypothetical protein